MADNIIKRIGKAITGKGYTVSDERGWFDLTGTKFGQGNWNQTDLLNQYSSSVYVFRCVKLIADSLSAIPYSLHRVVNTSGDIEKVDRHPVLDLLAKPNRFQTWQQLIKIEATNEGLTGEAYFYKVRNNRGEVVELWNIRPDYMRPKAGENEYISHYEMHVNGKITRFNVEDIVHFFSTNPIDNRSGQSPLVAGKDRVQIEEYANQFQRNFFLNSARPDAILKNKEQWSSEQKAEMRRDWNDNFQGVSKSSRVAFLEGGAEYQQVSTTQKEMDFISSMKFTRDDILMMYGVPKALLISEDANRAVSEAHIEVFARTTLEPLARQLFEALNEQLIKPDFGLEYILHFDSPVPERLEAIVSELEKGIDKWITRNEARQMRGFEPVEGGDVLFNEFSKIPLQATSPLASGEAKSVPVSGMKVFEGNPKLYSKMERKAVMNKAVDQIVAKYKAAKSKDSKADEPDRVSLLTTNDARDAYEIMVNKSIDTFSAGFNQQLNQVFEAQESRVAKRLDELGTDGVSADQVKEILGLESEKVMMATAMTPVFKDIAIAAGNEANKLIESQAKAAPDFKITQVLAKILEDRAEFFANTVNETTFEALADEVVESVKEGESIDKTRNRVNQVFETATKTRSALIARTESTFANNAGFQEAYSESAVVNGKEWIATKDSRTRAEHLAVDGEIVGVRDRFSNGLDYPSEPNCRCVIAPALIKV